jgi:Aspartyl protease
MFNLKGLGCIVLATATTATGTAETHCPGNVASVPYHLVNRYEIVVEVSINHHGPYSFLLDTGAQRTLLDSALAADLHLETEGEAEVAGPGFDGSASFAQTEVLEAAMHAVAGLKVLVYDFGYLRTWGVNVRGVLGEDFLERFDMLIENTHHLLCLDGSGVMGADVKGPHIPLLAPSNAITDEPVSGPLIVTAHLSDGMRPVRLALDSGTNTPFLFSSSSYMVGRVLPANFRQRGGNGALIYTALPPQDITIGPVQFRQVRFVTMSGIKKNPRTSEFDGLLTMGLFRRVFINHEGGFAVLDPM